MTRGAIVVAVIGGYVALMIAAVAATERSMEILIMAVPVIVPTFTPLVVSLVLHFSRRRVHDHADEKQSQGNALTLKHNETGLIP